MFKFILIATLMFSSISFANISGVWQGDLSINGKACKPTSVEIHETSDSLAIFASTDELGNHAFQCGPKTHQYYMWLEEMFMVKGNELWRYGKHLGNISDKGIDAKDGECTEKGCETWDFIKISRISENKITIWVDFDGAILTGELTK